MWRRFPLAKRRLAAYGPTDSGSTAIFDTALIVAAESRLAGLPLAVAERLCRAIPFLAANPAALRRKMRELPKIVARAYNPPDGQPIRTGCPRDTAHSGNRGTSRLRGRFTDYCDDACARTCPILRASQHPGLIVAASEFAHVYQSSIWAHGGGLGLAGRLVYERLACLALFHPDAPVQASSRYIAAKTGDLLQNRHVRRVLARFDALGLATLVDKRTGLRQVHILTPEAVHALEERLGTIYQVKANCRERRLESHDYGNWLHEQPARAELWALDKRAELELDILGDPPPEQGLTEMSQHMTTA